MRLTLFLLLLLSPIEAAAMTVRAAIPFMPAGLGNPFVALTTSETHSRGMVFDALTRIGPDNTLEPALALSWTAATPTVWRFDLRQNVQFSNGEKFDASSVVGTFRIIRSPEFASLVVAQQLAHVADVRAVGAAAVEIETTQPDPLLPKRIPVLQIVPSKTWAALGVEAFTQRPVGTGAYVLKDWGNASGLTVLEANPASWRAPKQITRVELRVLKEPTVRVQALLSDQVDLIQGLSPDDLPELTTAGMKTITRPGSAVMALALRTVNNEASPLRDQRVRQALNYAVDKDQIAARLLSGMATVASQGGTPGTFGYAPDLKPYPFDPAKAKALLKEAGFGKGFKLTLAALLGNTPGDAAIYQKVAEDLARVGVSLTVRPVSGAEWVRMYTSGDWAGADMMSVPWGASALYDNIWAIESVSCLKATPFYCDADMTARIQAAKLEFDAAKREKLQQDLMRAVVERAPMLMLVTTATYLAASPKLKSVIFTPATYRFEEMEIAP